MQERGDADVEAFLRAHSRAFLVGVRADGTPTGWPLIAFYTGTALEFSTYRRSQKVRIFQRNPNAACVIAPTDSHRALSMRGIVHIQWNQRGPSTGAAPPVDVEAKVRVELGDQTAGGVTSSKRVILRFEPGGARFTAGFAGLGGAGSPNEGES